LEDNFFAPRCFDERHGFMKLFNLHCAILLVIILLAATARAAATNSAPAPAAQVQSDTQDSYDDDADDWTFDSGLYTDDPKTGQRVWQYAKEKPVYSNSPSYSRAPRYTSGDPFFLPNTDMLFFQNTPDPFYAEPTSYPATANGIFSTSPYFYGLETGGDVPYNGYSEN
jgi:hypothetical protein